MRDKLGPRKILFITLGSLAVIAMGILYVSAGSLMDQVPKTEVAKESETDRSGLLSMSEQPAFSTVDPAAPPANQANDAPSTHANPSGTDQSPSPYPREETGSKKGNGLSRALRSIKAKLRD